MASVRIPPVLRPATGDRTVVEAGGTTLQAALDDLTTTYPELRDRLFDDEGGIRRFVNVYVDDEDVRHGDGLATTLDARSSIVILPAMAGGAA